MYDLLSLDTFNGDMNELKEFYLSQLNKVLLDESSHDQIKFLNTLCRLSEDEDSKDSMNDLKATKKSHKEDKLFVLMNELRELVQSDPESSANILKLIKGTNLNKIMVIFVMRN